MSIKIFDESIDVAVVGLTNSGKSTFISSLFNEEKFTNQQNIQELRNNDGGLTKVTTFYNLVDCEKPVVSDVVFNTNNILRGIDVKDIEAINKKLCNDTYKGFKIDLVELDENNSFMKSLETNLQKIANVITSDFEVAVKYINKKNADELIKTIKIDVPASVKTLELMKKYGFKSIVLRDTRGFLDINSSDVQQKTPTLYDSGLDGIQACIFMNGQDSVMPNLGREIYGEFVKSLFEAVPSFIVERSAKLAGKLEDLIDDNVGLSSSIYNDLVKNKRITNLNFNEINKFLGSLGIVDEDGNSANQLIDVHKREYLLPEVGSLKKNLKVIDDSDYEIFQFCIMEVFEKLLKTLSEFRELLNNIIGIFDVPTQLKSIHEQFSETFYTKYFKEIVKEYYVYSSHPYQIVRPVTQGYEKESLLNGLIRGQLLGSRGGITTRTHNKYLYGSIGVYAATMWNTLNIMIIRFDEEEDLLKRVKEFIKDSNENVLELCVLQIQQCLKYILQNTFTDIHAHFSGYPIVDRNQAKKSILEMRDIWNKEYSLKFGEDAIDKVYFTNIKEFLNENLPNYEISSFDVIRFSQLYKACILTTNQFFSNVSNNPLIYKQQYMPSL